MRRKVDEGIRFKLHTQEHEQYSAGEHLKRENLSKKHGKVERNHEVKEQKHRQGSHVDGVARTRRPGCSGHQELGEISGGSECVQDVREAEASGAADE